MDNGQIAAVFDQIADLLEFQAANPFRIRAYRNAARTIRDLPEPVAAIAADSGRKLTDIAGIGKDLADKVATLLRTGSLPMLDELLAEIPPSVLALLRIPGLGPKRAALLFRARNIATLDQLRAACESQQIRTLKGFGAKTEQAILAGIDLAVRAAQRIYWADAEPIACALVEHMRSARHVEQMEMAGSYRRRKDTVGDLDLLVVSERAADVMDCFGRFASVVEVLARGATKMSVRTAGGLQIDLRVVPAESFGAALQYFTGSQQHNVMLRAIARQRGLKINEWGVFRTRDDGSQEQIAGRTEQEVYAALELPCFPPELREARAEFEWAKAGPLPQLIQLDDIRGDLHAHTDASDGQATLAQMIDAARQRKLEYLAITDHSKRVTMAHGLGPARLRRQWATIDSLRKNRSDIRVLKGVECDILEQGGLDLPDEVLADADWVVASIHYGQNQSRARITQRILGAIENPHVSAIAHPTGRLINRRRPYEVDLEAVFAAARRHHKLLELNAHPSRLDLDDVACAAARQHGIPIVIGTDAHSTDGLDAMRYGVLQARRAGLTKEDVANTRTWDQVQRLLGRRRQPRQ
ncbi:MAG: DNA polymerase III subunit beta [Planctomycetes bacterium RBG_16_64_10]|nr:MAG: DNA polymerase III subunit beta [Planctomycetes bacterium RBG_16_64_10]